MIHSITLENFASFSGRSTLSLLGRRSDIQDTHFIPAASGQNLAKAAVIFGANASGKTNFLKGLAFLSRFSLSSWQELGQDKETCVQPFVLRSGQDQRPTVFEIVTEDEAGDVFTYGLSLTKKKVLRESLVVKKVGAHRSTGMFVRTENDIRLYPAAGCKTKDFPETIVRSNASFLSAIRQTTIPAFNSFIQTLAINCNVDTGGKEQPAFQYAQHLYENSALKKWVEDFLRNADTGVSYLDIRKTTMPNTPTFLVSAGHSNNGSGYTLPIEEEANGIRQLIPLLVRVFLSLETGMPFVFDNLGRGLHHLLLPVLLSVFYSPLANKTNAQIISTSHVTLLMNKLSKKQIFFTQKNDLQESSLYSLDSFEGIETDDNVTKKYLSGVYGGVPIL